MFVEYSSSPKTDSLEHPNNVFEMQNKMSNNLNSFQNHYGRYLRCQNEDTAKSVDPPCDFVGRDSFSELQNAYKNLMDDLTEIENVYEKQSDYNAKTAKVFNENEEQLDENYDNVLKMRKDLDNRLRFLQEYSNSAISPTFRRLDSVNLINILLVIFGCCLVYFLIFDL